MRQPLSVVRYLVILLALCFAAQASADDRAAARGHYQAGVKYYASGDYRSAIREFSSAQQLAPADLNNYNLALCYDKLGDAEPAIQYYRAFLDKQPNTDKRIEIEASISRLEAAVRSAESKKAEEARRAEEARKAEEARPPAGPPIGPPPGPAVAPAPGPTVGPSPAPAPEASPSPGPSTDERKRSGPAVAGSIGTPGTATPVPTGDSQIDRLNEIDIDQIREQRLGGAGSGLPDTRGGPAVAAGPQQGQPPAAGPSGANAPVIPAGTDQPKEKPVYKKWWFWPIAGVSAIVLYQVITSDSSSSSSRQGIADSQAGGLPLFRW